MKNPCVWLYQLVRKYPIRFLFTLLFIYVYTAIHEFIHYFTLLYFGYSSKIAWGLISIIKPDSSVSLYVKIIVSLAPYTLSLFLIMILFHFRKNIYVKIISSIAFFDIIWNMLMLPVSFWTGIPNDFVILYYMGKLWFIFAIGFIALIFWFFSVFKTSPASRKPGARKGKVMIEKK